MFQYNRNLLHLEPQSTWPTPIGPWIYWSASLWLISLSSDGSTWYTIADKNIGATTVWHEGDVVNANNTGYFFQWGNNYGFPHSWATTTSSTPVLIYGKSWRNPYSSSTFITTTGNTWIDAQIGQGTVNDLWGNWTSTDLARQWPCPSGFRVWENDDVMRMYNAYYYIDTSNPRLSSGEFFRLLLMPKGWLLRRDDGTLQGEDRYGYYWTSAYSWGEDKAVAIYPNENYSATHTYVSAPIAWGYSIRPMKNTPVTPDSTWTLIWNGYV